MVSYEQLRAWALEEGQENPVVVELQEDHAKLHKAHAKLKAKTAGLRQMKTELEQETSSLKTALAASETDLDVARGFQKAAEVRLSNLREATSSLQRNYDDTLKKERATLTKEHKDALKRKDDEHAATVAELQRKHAADLDSAKKTYEDKKKLWVAEINLLRGQLKATNTALEAKETRVEELLTHPPKQKRHRW